MNAILYIIRSGIQWRLMPNDFPSWRTVYDHFSRWNKWGVWGEMPGLTDNLSSPKSGTLCRGKKLKGHKRHIVVDIFGNLLHVKVHAANLSDTKSACEVLEGVADIVIVLQNSALISSPTGRRLDEGL
ncbi:MAG: transposase [Nitrosomonas communis]|nr:transposase [Nitrosomonas communis]